MSFFATLLAAAAVLDAAGLNLGPQCCVRVVGVEEHDFLNVRSEPLSTGEIVATLSPNATGIEIIECQSASGTIAGDDLGSIMSREGALGRFWCQVQTPVGTLGWAYAGYLQRDASDDGSSSEDVPTLDFEQWMASDTAPSEADILTSEKIVLKPETAPTWSDWGILDDGQQLYVEPQRTNAFGNEGPSSASLSSLLRNFLNERLDHSVDVRGFQISATENTGSVVEPDVRGRFSATVVLMRPMFRPAYSMAGFSGIELSAPEGTEVEIFGFYNSSIFQNNWRVQFDTLSLSREIDGFPQSMHSNPLIVGTETELNAEREIIRRRLNNDYQVYLQEIEQRSATIRARTEEAFRRSENIRLAEERYAQSISDFAAGVSGAYGSFIHVPAADQYGTGRPVNYLPSLFRCALPSETKFFTFYASIEMAFTQELSTTSGLSHWVSTERSIGPQARRIQISESAIQMPFRAQVSETANRIYVALDFPDAVERICETGRLFVATELSTDRWVELSERHFLGLALMPAELPLSDHFRLTNTSRQSNFEPLSLAEALINPVAGLIQFDSQADDRSMQFSFLRDRINRLNYNFFSGPKNNFENAWRAGVDEMVINFPFMGGIKEYISSSPTSFDQPTLSYDSDEFVSVDGLHGHLILHEIDQHVDQAAVCRVRFSSEDTFRFMTRGTSSSHNRLRAVPLDFDLVESFPNDLISECERWILENLYGEQFDIWFLSPRDLALGIEGETLFVIPRLEIQ